MAKRVYIDGEQIPDEHIQDIFRRPPEIPDSFERSGLLVGSRGAGKTTLFRFLKVTHPGTAIHLALAADLATFSQDEAIGPLGRGYPETLQELVAKKAASLLAVALAERFLRKRLTPKSDLLAACLPATLAPRRAVSLEWCRETRTAVSRTPLEAFEACSRDRALAHLVASAGEAASKSGRPLLLLFDRADMVVPAALRCLVDLLDQSVQSVSLVALRPGHASEVFAARDLNVIPGDHYSVVHLGSHPYDTDWQNFLQEAVAAQFGPLQFAALPAELRNSALWLSRDSLRSALEIFLALRGATSEAITKAFARALAHVRENQVVAGDRVLAQFRCDYRRLLNDIRKEVISRDNRVAGPVHLSIKENRSGMLWESSGRLVALINAALRSRAACMPQGMRWIPGMTINEVELPPVVLWQEGDAPWSKPLRTTSVTKNEGDLFDGGGGRNARAIVFVAYRMSFTKSKNFRERLETILRAHPGDPRIEIRDGRVHPGEEWAPTIRQRISKARLVVADVTGLRNDVLFELGFAFGLGRRVIPVVESPDVRERVPEWLSATQIGSYETDSHLMSVATSIRAHIAGAGSIRPRKARDPVPGLAVWINAEVGRNPEREQFLATCEREGLSSQILGSEDGEERIIDQAARATLLVATLNGGPGDALVHFISGAIAARPKAGYSGITLDRKIALLAGDNEAARDLTAASLRRCTGIISLIPGQGSLHDVVARIGLAHRKWLGPKSA